MSKVARVCDDDLYRLVSRPVDTEVEWRPERAADGKVRVYPKLGTARSVRSQLENQSRFRQYYEYKIQKCSTWEDVE